MSLCQLQSDQLYTWSDIHAAEKVLCHLAKTPPSSSAPPAPTPSHPARITDRALQTLWQAWLQMCRWPRPRPEVLSVGKQTQKQTTDGLCSTRFKAKGRRILSKLSKGKDHFRRALRNQSRAFTQKGEVLARSPPKVRDCHDGYRSARC